MLFRRNIASLNQVRELIDAIRDLLGSPIVAIDHEGGLVSRFPHDTPVSPSAYALGLLRDFDAVEESCRIQAQLLASLGINLNFAPVLDLFRSAESGAIGTRAFSSDPQKVAEYGSRTITEYARSGIGTCAKHFPGQGRTAVDTHFSQGEVEYQLDEMERTDLCPFRKAIAAGVPSVMVSHLKYRTLDRRHPASLSSKIVEELLRKRMGFEKLAVADCVEMAGLSADYAPEKIISLGLEAGIDLWISSYSQKRSYPFQIALKEAYEKAVRSTSELAERADRSLTRIKQLLEKYPGKPASFDREKAFAGMKSIHRTTLQKIRQSPLPDTSTGLMLIELSNDESPDLDAKRRWNVVSEVLSDRKDLISSRSPVPKNDRHALKQALAQAIEHRLTPIVLTANAYRWKGYRELAKLFKQMESYVHIALLDRRDLFGITENEWVTWGFNGLTGHMLADELSTLLDFLPVHQMSKMKSPSSLFCRFLDGMTSYAPIEPPDRIAQRLRLSETDIVKLNANENPYGTAPFVLEALGNGKYYHIYPDLAQVGPRERIAEYAGVSSGNIVVGTGADELIDLICRLVVEPGDKVLSFAPTFAYYSHAIRLNRGVYQTHPRERDYSISLEKAQSIDLKGVKLVILCSPNNPTGNMLEASVLEYFLKQDLLVLVDEAYYEFSRKTFLSRIERADNLIILRTFSKCFGLAGLRVGYGIMSKPLADGLMRLKPPFSVNVAAEVALTACLNHLDHYRKQVDEMIETREWLIRELKKEKLLEVFPSESNFIWCRIGNRPAREVKELLEAKGILIRYFDTEITRNYIRISIGTKPQSELFLKELKDVLSCGESQ